MENLRLCEFRCQGFGLICCRMVQRVHDTICHALRTSSIKLVRPVVEVEEETHEVRADSELVVTTVGIAHSAEKARVQTGKFALLVFVESRQVDHPQVRFLGHGLGQRVDMHSERNGGNEVGKLDDGLFLLRFDHLVAR